ncbi:MAG: ABC transporter permease [Firmicutes bacterium]|nr:ABC transporter permease [Bacillota bacterium]
MQAIFKRELRSYFRTMTGPVFIAALMAFVGVFFVLINLVQGYSYFSAVLSNITIIFLLIVPILTMRSFAEEKRAKTDQLLLTSPVSVTDIVMGKYLSMIALLGICCLVMCLAPIIIHFYGGGSLAVDFIAILEFFLLGSAYIAIGMFISTLTESQVIAAVGTFFILLLLQLVNGFSNLLPTSARGSYVCFFAVILLIALLVYYLTRNYIISGGVAAAGIVVLTILFFAKKTILEGAFAGALSSLSLIARFDDIMNQTFNLSAVIYYLSVCGLFVFLSVQAIQKRRWS